MNKAIRNRGNECFFRELAQRVADDLFECESVQSVYLIGSLANGRFLEGFSDIDLLAYGEIPESRYIEQVFVSELDNTPDWRIWKTGTPLNDLKIQLVSCCIRPGSHLRDPLGPIRWCGCDEIRSFKDISALDDLVMLNENAVLLGGEEQRQEARIPSVETYRDYLHWVEASVERNCANLPPKNRYWRGIAKTIITAARSYVYLWTAKFPSSIDSIPSLLKPLIESDDSLEILSIAMRVVQLSPDDLVSTRENIADLKLLLDGQKRFLEHCFEIDRRRLRRSLSEERPILMSDRCLSLLWDRKFRMSEPQPGLKFATVSASSQEKTLAQS